MSTPPVPAAESSRHDPVSKLLIIGVAIAALVLEALIGIREWSAIWPLTIGAFGLSAFLVRIAGPYGLWPALVIAFIHPAMFLALREQGRIIYSVIWFGAMLGAILARGNWRIWALPSPWKLPVVFWGLVVAVSWPLLVGRETGFDLTLLDRYNTASSAAGGPAPIVVVWISTVVLTHLVSVLFFDWCFAAFPAGRLRAFAGAVAAPLCVGGILGAALAVYQGTVDINFWSGHQWPLHNRAAGGLVDGDAFGALAGFWSAASVALVSGLGPWLGALGVLGILAHWAGLWASGSRMALVAGAIGAAGVLLGLILSWRQRSGVFRAVAVLALAAGIALPAVFRFRTDDPFTRIKGSLPALDRAAIAKFAESELFNRGAPYGTASLQMVEHYPLSGVGLSSFLTVFPDYSYNISRLRASQENAQSWYRQQLAELGFVGSLGAFVWVWLCLRLLSRSFAPRLGLGAPALAGALISVGLVCAVSLPTQHPAVSFTVWVFVAWLAMLVGPFQPASVTVRLLNPSPGRWAAIWVLIAVFGASTLVSAFGKLSVPQRAVMGDWTYSLGFHAEEAAADGSRYRWTEERAVEVIPTLGPWLRLSIGGGPGDIAARPQRLRVWRNDGLVIDTLRQDTGGQTWYVGVPEIGRRMIVRIEVDRVWTTPGDRRTFGVSVGPWEFAAAPPAGAQVIR